MSGVKRTRTDEIPSSSQPQTTINTTISPKVEKASSLTSNIEEDYNCPICFELINEAFVSRCGHSF
ncbi:unnamed protein product, partial [Rotaria magnacalcarata]